MRTIMYIGVSGSRRTLEKLIQKLLKIKNIRIFYVSWPMNNEGGDRRGGDLHE